MAASRNRIEPKESPSSGRIKANQEILDIVDMFKHYADDQDVAFDEALARLKAEEFKGKPYMTMGAILPLVKALPEGLHLVRAGVFKKVQEIVSRYAKYEHPPYVFDIVHPQIGILRRRPEKAAHPSMMGVK
jgi:hypothetical protein